MEKDFELLKEEKKKKKKKKKKWPMDKIFSRNFNCNIYFIATKALHYAIYFVRTYELINVVKRLTMIFLLRPLFVL